MTGARPKIDARRIAVATMPTKRVVDRLARLHDHVGPHQLGQLERVALIRPLRAQAVAGRLRPVEVAGTVGHPRRPAPRRATSSPRAVSIGATGENRGAAMPVTLDPDRPGVADSAEPGLASHPVAGGRGACRRP